MKKILIAATIVTLITISIIYWGREEVHPTKVSLTSIETDYRDETSYYVTIEYIDPETKKLRVASLRAATRNCPRNDYTGTQKILDSYDLIKNMPLDKITVVVNKKLSWFISFGADVYKVSIPSNDQRGGVSSIEFPLWI